MKNNKILKIFVSSSPSLNRSQQTYFIRKNEISSVVVNCIETTETIDFDSIIYVHFVISMNNGDSYEFCTNHHYVLFDSDSLIDNICVERLSKAIFSNKNTTIICSNHDMHEYSKLV